MPELVDASSSNSDSAESEEEEDTQVWLEQAKTGESRWGEGNWNAK